MTLIELTPHQELKNYNIFFIYLEQSCYSLAYFQFLLIKINLKKYLLLFYISMIIVLNQIYNGFVMDSLKKLLKN